MVLDEFPLDEYNTREGPLDREHLRNCMISPARANAYPQQFKAWQIIELVKEGISPEDAAMFSDRFSAWAITGLVKGNCSPEEAEKYDARFDENDIKYMAEVSCFPDDANRYNKRFKGHSDISEMFRAKVSQQRADDYNKRFTGEDIAKLARVGCSPEQADKYSTRFEGKGIAKMFQAGCDPSTAELYPSRFDGKGIAEMVKVHCPPARSRKYHNRFSGFDIAALFSAGVTPHQARVYDKQFEGHGIVELIKAGVSPEKAESYHREYDAWAIAALVKANVSPEGAEGYGPESFSSQVRFLAVIGCNPSDYIMRQHGELVSYLTTVMRGLENRRTYPFGFESTERLIIPFQEERFHLLGAGRQSLVLLDKEEGKAYKCSHDLQLEVRLFKKLQQDHGKTSNVIQLVEELERGYVDIIELEYVKGRTLLGLLKENSVISPEWTLKYSNGIFHGLLELRKSGIFHRDLWLSNILVEEETGRTVIIDLGLATDQPNAPKLGNRRYGGENDIQSLGQIVYKMATGRNLFNDTEESTAAIPSEVQECREEAYRDQSLLEEKLGEVEGNVRNPQVQEIIRTCLTARSREDNTNFAPDEVYDRLNQLFQIP